MQLMAQVEKLDSPLSFLFQDASSASPKHTNRRCHMGSCDVLRGLKTILPILRFDLKGCQCIVVWNLMKSATVSEMLKGEILEILLYGWHC